MGSGTVPCPRKRSRQKLKIVVVVAHMPLSEQSGQISLKSNKKVVA